MSIINEEEKRELGRILTDHGITASFHRLLILRELRGRRDHPSADMLWQTLSPMLPTLSKTTVYNTLGLFEGHGLASSLPIEGHEMRYDHDCQGQIHFYCLVCHAIIDPPETIQAMLPQAPMDGFEVKRIQTVVKGICSNCQSRESRNQTT
jgi:Fe2+ or Zn2+ uptake regulation protein